MEVSQIGEESSDPLFVVMDAQNNGSFLREFSSLNYNVKLILIITLLSAIGRGIWAGNLLSAYIFFLGDESNELLGLTSAAAGFAMTLFVLPSGWLSDRFRRDYMIRAASLTGFLALVIIFFAQEITAIFLGLVVWGACQGMARPSQQALFADSVESGKRSKIYAIQHVMMQLGMAAGPFLNVLLFLIHGDSWALEVLRNVILVGLLLSGISLLTMFLLNDNRGIGTKSEAISTGTESSQKEHEETDFQSNRSWKRLVMILLVCNLIVGMGAGMTIRFFTIFFLIEYDMLPIAVQLIMGVAALGTAAASLLAQRFSQTYGFGRVWMIFIVQSLAILFLITLIFYPPVLILVPVFIARQALMNASQPLSRSILMDNVPIRHRGLINSFQAMAWGLFWNFSAAIGGFIIGSGNNFRLVFIITASVYIAGTLPVLLLRGHVPQEMDERTTFLLQQDSATSEDQPSPLHSQER